jgi:hypothetical protein
METHFPKKNSAIYDTIIYIHRSNVKTHIMFFNNGSEFAKTIYPYINSIPWLPQIAKFVSRQKKKPFYTVFQLKCQGACRSICSLGFSTTCLLRQESLNLMASVIRLHFLIKLPEHYFELSVLLNSLIYFCFTAPHQQVFNKRLW